MRNLLFLLGTLLPFFLFSQQIEKHISYGGENIGFYEYKPTSYQTDQSGKYPLIIFLHGIGERGNGTSELWKVKRIAIPHYIDQGNPMRFYKDGKWHNFIVLSPQCNMKYGMWPTLYVDALIEYAEKNLRIDRSRIYLTGLSMGGGGTWKYLSESLKNANKIAAAATVCAPATITNGCNIASSKLPMWSFHAKDDPTVNISVITNMLNKILACSPAIQPLKTIWSSGGHEIWDKAYDTEHKYQTPNVFEWFLGYSRNDASEGPDSGPVAKPGGSNKAPAANAGTDKTINVSYNSVLLNGTLSNDTDGWLTSYVWKQVSGPTTATISNKSIGQVYAKNLVEGTYVFRLTVTDNSGATAYKDVNIYVKKTGSTGNNNQQQGTQNQAPVPMPGSDQLIHLPGNSVLLNGTLSYDKDGYISSFQWTKVSGPAKYRIESPTSGKTRVYDLQDGNYVFRLTVKDGKGASASSNVKIRVNAPPKVNAGKDITITLPTNSVLLKGTPSNDPGGWIKAFSWNKMRGPNQFSIATPSKGDTRINNLVAGDYTIRLTVTDGDGATAYDEVFVHVKKNSTVKSSAVAEEDVAVNRMDSIAAIADQKNTTLLSMRPNPASANITVTCNSNKSGNAALSIYDISGRIVKTVVFRKDHQTWMKNIDISGLNKGIYLLSLSVENIHLTTERFVKQ